MHPFVSGSYRSVVSELHGRCVLARNDGARVDRLALTEQVWMFLTACLFGGQPLESASLRAGFVLDDQGKLTGRFRG